MEAGLVQTVAQYAEEVMGKEGFRYVSAVVANCKMLALELEAQQSHLEPVDTEALIIAAYLHDISTVAYGYHEHQLKSAEMAVEFLQRLDMPAERISKVEQAILAHMTAFSPDEREAASIEGRILYDADKLGRLSGLAVV